MGKVPGENIKQSQNQKQWAFNDPHDPDHPRNRVNITEEIIDIEENHRHYTDDDEATLT